MSEILKVNNLSISFGGIKAIDDLSFNVKKNQIYGIIGPNGAGKTTAFNCITGFYKPNSGSITFYDKNNEEIDLINLQTHKIIHKGLVRSFQNIELIADMSLLDNLLVGSHIHYKASLIEAGLRLFRSNKEEREQKNRALEILKFLDLENDKDKMAAHVPYGVLKKIELGRCLMSQPSLMLLDEPAASLNESETKAMIELLLEIKKNYDLSILLVEHDMALVMSVCDQICTMDFGKKIAEGNPEYIQNNKDVQIAYLGDGE